jgi:hypothetical protein
MSSRESVLSYPSDSTENQWQTLVPDEKPNRFIAALHNPELRKYAVETARRLGTAALGGAIRGGLGTNRETGIVGQVGAVFEAVSRPKEAFAGALEGAGQSVVGELRGVARDAISYGYDKVNSYVAPPQAAEQTYPQPNYAPPTPAYGPQAAPAPPAMGPPSAARF